MVRFFFSIGVVLLFIPGGGSAPRVNLERGGGVSEALLWDRIRPHYTATLTFAARETSGNRCESFFFGGGGRYVLFAFFPRQVSFGVKPPRVKRCLDLVSPHTRCKASGRFFVRSFLFVSVLLLSLYLVYFVQSCKRTSHRKARTAAWLGVYLF